MREPVAKPKRFYREAKAEAGLDGHVLMLDGRPARTPAKNPLALPTRALGEAVAAEWAAQGETIDPSSMPLTRFANSAIDGVARDMAAVRAELARYAGSDLVMYRADAPEGLVRAQAEAWDPVLDWARESLGARFVLSEGVTFVAQPETSLARVSAALEGETSPFRLAALHVMTTLSGSVLLALMHEAGAISAEAAWRAAHVDEFFQEILWGLDAEAAERRSRREAEFLAASRILALSTE
ncbi:ATP12 family protein [Enterovirga sp.]|uniref:ATP12 family chaperone protein n=1 Tax=Enterovirga sp. TaxID=2026350 RepID=UPI002B8A2F85|nr:ATP12 family protein [Enterovirga sp.]HMO28212.1 ATP12 family protein [Enterovirga sp.]